jgi:hypothetical protein
MLKKFPVTKNGVQYRVEISESCWTEDIWYVVLYKKVKSKILGIPYMSNVYDYKAFGVVSLKHNFKDVEYIKSLDFILMADKTIEEYEKVEVYKNECSRTLDNATKKFKEWDGKL